MDLDLAKGEVHAHEENRAGKTTLMRILYGLTSLDEAHRGGWQGVTDSGRPGDAIATGIGMVVALHPGQAHDRRGGPAPRACPRCHARPRLGACRGG
ncbi:MAG: hypothetical protein R3C32_12965 [Chloroflexota bacterium]